MKTGKMNKFHKIVTVELLSTIDHKLRGVQQFIVALRGLIEEEALKDLGEEVHELQALYEPYLKLRDLDPEETDIGKFIEDNYNIQTGVFCSVDLDREKTGFIFDFLIEYSKENYELSLKSTDRGCRVVFSSSSISDLSEEDFKLLSNDIEQLPFFAVGKILARMGAEFSVIGTEMSIEFLSSDKES